MTLSAVSLLCLGVVQVAGYQAAGAASDAETGFSQPFAGAAQYEQLAPTQVTDASQLNQPIGQQVADELAGQFGLTRADAFTPEQYQEFITGQGHRGKLSDAKTIDASIKIFTNTTGRPLYSNIDGHLTPSVLASYGLFVTTDGTLESLAHEGAPTREANSIIAPGGYLGKWCRANGAQASLTALYKSAYTTEVTYGTKSQFVAKPAEVVLNQINGVRSVVGMSMVPSIWIVNFVLLYVLNPAVAAEMPAKWAPIPARVDKAIHESDTGQVPFGEYASDFPNDGR
jgi:hypothetical protein